MGSSPISDVHEDSIHDLESGYVSGSSSQADLPQIYFTKPHLAFLNRQLQHLEPQGMEYCPDLANFNADLMAMEIYYDGALRLCPLSFKRLHSVSPALLLLTCSQR